MIRVVFLTSVVRGFLPQVYSPTTMPFALLSFTGSDYFNRSMRHYAKRKGLSLSDHGVQFAVRFLSCPRTQGGLESPPLPITARCCAQAR